MWAQPSTAKAGLTDAPLSADQDGVNPPGAFRPDIQSLRAVAVVLVVLYHARVPGFTGGFVGVDVFFVISGFVIGSSLLREIDRTGRVRLRAFYWRRARRLLPAFALATLFALVVGTLVMPVGDGQVAAARTALAATFSVSNLYLMSTGDRYFAPTVEDNPFLHTWSLGVEEQFYLVIPIAIAAGIAAGRLTKLPARRLFVVVTCGLTVASFVFGVRSLERDLLVGFYHPAARFWEIGVGMVLAALPGVQGVSRFVATAAVMSTICAIGGVTFLYTDQTLFPGVAALPPVVATGLVILLLPVSGFHELSSSPIGSWIGDRSYGWYLWHWPMILFAAELIDGVWWVLLAAGVAALGPTAVSYRWVEQPIRTEAIVLTGWRLPVAAGVTVVLVASAAASGVAGASSRWGIETPDLRATSLGEKLGCHSARDVVDPAECTIERDGPIRLLLVGDSHALSISDGLGLAADAVDASLTMITYDGCNAFGGYEPGDCSPYIDRVMDWIREIEPTHVVVSHFALHRTDDGDSARLAEWSAALGEFADDVHAVGAELVVVDDPPIFEAVTSVRQSLLRPQLTPATMSKDQYEAQRAAVRAAEHRVADGSLDPSGAVCDDAMCSTRSPDGVWLYYDRDHLNVAGSRRAGRTMLAQLQALLAGEP